MNRNQKHACIIFFICLTYAITRYCVLGDVPITDIPLFITNKALAMTGLLLFGFAGLTSDKNDRRTKGILATAVVFIHVLATLVLYSHDYFKKLGDSSEQHMYWYAQISMLASIIASLCLVILLRASDRQSQSQTEKSLVPGLGRIVLICILLHLAFMGWKGWLDVSSWPGSLPPITLLGTVACIIFLLISSRR